MKELITLLTEKAGITTEQASKVLNTVKDYVKDKYPMMAGAVDNLLGSGDSFSSGAPEEKSEQIIDKADTSLGDILGGIK